MKIKIIYAGSGFLFGILLAFIIFTNIPITNGTRNIYPEFEYVIPDEATAIKVAEAIFDAAHGTDYKVGTEVRAEFLEHKNAWSVYYARVLSENPERFSTAELPAVTIRKDNGMILRIGLQED